ncbi:MAG: Gfo/Idh/MocA family oxidoreductase [Candidatus Omnitrophica bacterium]|nr:Gfo/Idh/MocA family oxidoreductase [Candidatus Omnitrophota bacterium]
MSRVHVGVIGVGHLGAIHARIYAQLSGARLAGVCDVLPERAAAVAHAHGATAYTQLSKLLPQVQAVSIAVPTAAHFTVAKQCLAAGVHVLLEKPITRTLAQADALLALARRRHLTVQVGHVERFNSAFQGIAKVLKEPRFIECHRLGPYTQRGTDVGVVLDLMIHDIDIVLWLVGQPVRRIDAVGVSILSASEDIANARLTFANGAVANLTASRVTPETLRKIRLFQSDTYISVDYAAQAAKVFQKHHGAIAHRELPIQREEPLKAELASFLEAVRRGHRPVVTGEDAREALRVALTITRKILKGSDRRCQAPTGLYRGLAPSEEV